MRSSWLTDPQCYDLAVSRVNDVLNKYNRRNPIGQFDKEWLTRIMYRRFREKYGKPFELKTADELIDMYEGLYVEEDRIGREKAEKQLDSILEAHNAVGLFDDDAREVFIEAIFTVNERGGFIS